QSVARRYRGHGVVETRLRAVAAAHIKHDRSNAPSHGHLRPHAIGPEPIDLALLERPRRRETEVDAFSGRARHRRDFHIVPIEIKTGLNEKPAKPHVDPGRCSDAATLNHLEIPSPGSQVLMHDKKPVHALSLRTEQLDALPLRKGGERRMSGSANE